MNFNLRPYDGAGSLSLGMSRAEVHEKIGPPERSWTMRSGNIAESWPVLVVRYDKETRRILELEFTSDAQVEYEGIDLFRDPEALSKLVDLDGSALQGTGTVILLRLGISMTANLGDQTSSDRTVCLFNRGRWDAAITRLTPYASNY